MDSFKSTLAKQKFNKQVPQVQAPQLQPSPQTGTNPLNIPAPPHAAPQTGTQSLNVPGPPYVAPQTGTQAMHIPSPPPRAAPQTGTQALHTGMAPPHAAPQPKVASAAQSLIHNPPMSAPRATSTVQLMMHSPPMSAPKPGQEPPATQAIGNVPAAQGGEAPKTIFDVLEERQINFSNNYIRNMNYKAEMFTRDEASNLSLQTVFLHSDGVLRYQQEIRGEIRQTPLFIMEG